MKMKRKLLIVSMVLGLSFMAFKLSAEVLNSTKKMYILITEVYGLIKYNYVKDVKDETLAEGAAVGMLSSLDPYSSYLNEKEFEAMRESSKGEFGGLGIEIMYENGIKVIAPMDDTPAYFAGIKAGDLIVYVDDVSIMNIPANEAVAKIRGPKGTKVKIKVLREGEDAPLEFEIVRDNIKMQVVKHHVFGQIGYIRISNFYGKVSDIIKRSIVEMEQSAKAPIKGYIIDLRNDPGGLLDQAIKVADLFLDSGVIVSTKGRHKKDDAIYHAKNGSITSLPLVVMIDAGSASASEIVAGALQDHKRATILGTRSFGKASVQSVIPLVNSKGAVKITTAGYYTPSGKSIMNQGISPDIVVEYKQNDNLKKMSKIEREKLLRSDKRWDNMLESDNQLQESIKLLSLNKNLENNVRAK